MTTPDTADSLGTTAKTVRFPTMLAGWLEDRANDQDRSFSQEVILACRGHRRSVEEPDRSELETPAPDQAPAFTLVGPKDGPWVAEVEGKVVPHLSITKIEDGDWTRYEQSLGHSGEGYMLSLDDRFAVMAHSYNELWRWGWFLAHAIALGAGRASHTHPGRLPQVIEEGWKVMADSGSCGRTFEITTTFVLPAMDRSDQWAYAARDAMRHALHDLGGHDIVTRLIALGSLEHEDGPISWVETFTSDGIEEERTFETLPIEMVDDAVSDLR